MFTRPYIFILLCSFSLACAAGEPLTLIWSDEFDGIDIDRSKWDFDLGNGFYNYEANQWISGWGNNELQFYTRDPENAFIKGGALHIRAIKESIHGCGFSSARIKSRSRDGSRLFSQKYGRFEFRAKLPRGKGLWPALWLLPQDEKYGRWAASGEIDVMEAKGQEPQRVHGTLHYGGSWPANVHTGNEFNFSGNNSIEDFNVYAVEWDPGEIRWYVNGACYSTQSFWWGSSEASKGKGVTPAREADLLPWPAPFDQPFYIVMNLAVGGQFLGNPDQNTVFPAEMVIDYVRVYARKEAGLRLKPRGSGKLPF